MTKKMATIAPPKVMIRRMGSWRMWFFKETGSAPQPGRRKGSQSYVVWWKQTMREAVPHSPSSQDVVCSVNFSVGLSQVGRRRGRIALR